MTTNLNINSFQSFITQLSVLDLRKNTNLINLPVSISSVLNLNISVYSDFLNQFSPLYKTHLAAGNLINSFTLFGPKRDEVKNVALLDWVFDSHASHGQGASFFHAYLDILRERYPLENALHKKHWQSYLVQTELNPFGDNANRIDMVFKAKDAVIYIEVKVDAGEGLEQLARYKKKLKQEKATHKALVFLTTKQDFESESDCPCSNWGDVASALKPTIVMTDFPKTFFEQLAKHFAGLKSRNTSKKQ